MLKSLKNYAYLISVFLLIFVAGRFFTFPKSEPLETVEPYHQLQFFEYAQFIEKELEQPKSNEKIDLDVALAGIVPHHIPTTIPLLVEFYTKLKNTREVKTFVVIGPDHFDKSRSEIAVSKKTFVTPFSSIKPNLEIIEKLEKSGFVMHDEASFSGEFSIHAQLLIIGKLFPEAQIVPLVIRSNNSNKKARVFGKVLADVVDNDTFVIGSVDFSHYLSEKQANPLDNLSANVLSAITSRFGGLVEADSTQTLVILMSFLEEREANQSVDLQVFNTGDFTDNRDFTTGYVTGFWGIVKSEQ
jgi:AmmeMemoRadiSam system protein B